MNDKDWLTTQQVADWLQVHRRHVLRLIDGGRLIASDVSTTGVGNASWRIRREDLETFLSERTEV